MINSLLLLWREKLGGNKKGREDGAEEEYGIRRHRHHICSCTNSFLLSLSPDSLLCHSSRKKKLQREFSPKPNLIRDNVGAYQELLNLTNCKDKIRVFSNTKKNISGSQFLSIIIDSERIRFYSS